RARQRRVRPNERLTDATVHLDVGVLERDAHGRGLEGLLVNRDGGDRAGLRVNFDRAGEREADARRDKTGQRPEVDLHTGLADETDLAELDTAADLVSGLERA